MDRRIRSSSDGRHTTPFRRIKAFKLITRAFLRADKGHVLGCFLAFAQINAALLIEILLVVPAFGSHETSFPWWFMAWKAMENAPALKYYDGVRRDISFVLLHHLSIFMPPGPRTRQRIPTSSSIICSCHLKIFFSYSCVQHIFFDIGRCHDICCNYLTQKEVFTLYCFWFANGRTGNRFLIAGSIGVLFILGCGMSKDHIAFSYVT